jgi:hypothetical protein
MTSGHTDPAYQRENGACRTPCRICNPRGGSHG